MCRQCNPSYLAGGRYCTNCGASLNRRPSSSDDLTSGIVGAAVGAATDSAMIGAVAGTLVGGSLVGGLLGALGGDLLDGSIDD